MEEPRSKFRGLFRSNLSRNSSQNQPSSPAGQQHQPWQAGPQQAPPAHVRAPPQEVEEEHVRLALAISAAEAEHAAASGPPGHQQQQQSPPRALQPDTSRDEELARQLQQQLDGDLGSRGSGSTGGGLGSNVASGTGGGVILGQPPQPAAPLLLPPLGGLASLRNLPAMRHAGNSAGDAAASPQPPSPTSGPPSTPGSMRPLVSPPAAAPAPPSLFASSACGTCNKPVRLWQSHAVAGGKKFHSWCLRCGHCRDAIQAGPGSLFLIGQDQKPYHQQCHKAHFHPKCSVCRGFLPQGADGIVRFHLTPFWLNRFCAEHERDGTPRCMACNRLQIQGEQWVQTEAGRYTCLECLATLVRNTKDAQPLYDDVLSLYASLGMPLPTRPPLLLVESAALNEATHTDCGPRGKTDGPVFHTRGLTLSEEHRSIRTVMGTRRDAGRLMSVVPQFNTVQSSRWEVTALLVLFGLPWLLTGSILAHEVMHAWLRLAGYQRLPTEVEEGLAQLMALLWLEQQTPQPGSYEERLSSYLGKQIREDTSMVYGDGFRAAHDAFQQHGLPKLLEHVRRHGRLPE